MKRLLLLLLYVFLSVTNAQSNVSNDSSYDELVNLYANSLFKDDSKALDFAFQAKGVALVNGNDEQLAKAFYYISKCQYRLNENKKALKNIELAISKKEALNDLKFLHKCLCLKGDILSVLGEDSKALVVFLEARKYGKLLGDPIYEIAPLSNIAYIKKIHKDFQEAIRLYKDILKYINTVEDTNDTAYYKLLAFMNIADIYLWLENPDEAEFYNEAGLKKCSKEKDTWAYYPLLMNSAIIFYQKGQYEKSISIANQVRDFAKPDIEGLYLTSLLYLGKSSYKLHAYEKAIHYLEKAYAKVSTSDNVGVNEKELHEFLALAYHESGNSEKTVFHFQKYTALEKKQSTEDLKLNNETHELMDVLPLKTEINKLGEELTTETKTKKNLFIIAILLLFLFIGSVLYYILHKKTTKKKIKELLKKVAALENGQEEKVVVKKDKIFDEKARIILNKIAEFEKKEQYLDIDCSLGFMAEKLETNTTYLSKVINTYKEKSFTAYMTELRINTALLRLKNDKTLQSYTIQGIAEEFGFKRQETFSRAFKAHTGIYPSQYLKNL